MVTVDKIALHKKTFIIIILSLWHRDIIIIIKVKSYQINVAYDAIFKRPDIYYPLLCHTPETKVDDNIKRKMISF